MKIHEFQGKNIFKRYGIPIQDGYVIEKTADASPTIEKVQQEFSSDAVMVKAQIHAGGRGKGGGVKYCPTTKDALENVSKMLGMNLVTPQTGVGGQKVRKVYITEALDIQKEYYCALTLDRAKTKDVFMVSTEGGVEIEKVAAETPEKIIKVWIDPLLGMKTSQARKLGLGLGLGRRFAEVRALELPLELLHTSRGVDELLLPREERMAHVTDVHVQLRHGAPRGEAVSTCTGHLALDIFWMNLFFHNDNLPKFSSHIDQTSYYNRPSGKDKRVHLVVGA